MFFTLDPVRRGAVRRRSAMQRTRCEKNLTTLACCNVNERIACGRDTHRRNFRERGGSTLPLFGVGMDPDFRSQSCQKFCLQNE